MDLLLLTGVNADGEAVLDAVTFEVKGDGKPLDVDSLGGVRIPAQPRPIRLEVTAKPPAQFFEVTGHFDYHGQGDLRPAPDQDLRSTRASFAPIRAVMDGLGNTTMSQLVYMGRLRDVSAQVLRLLQQGPDRRTEYGEVKTLDLDGRTVSVIAKPPIVARDMVFEKRSTDPDTETIVFELKVEPAPKLIAVVWPKTVERTYKSPAPPLLVYFHPNAAQNRDTHYRGAYPFSWDFLFFGIITYIKYAKGLDGPDPDPLHDIDGLKGLPYQISFSGKKVVLVLPVNRVGAEVGVLLKADSMGAVLKDIVGFMFRRQSVYKPSELGRTGLASFSAGNTLVTQFLNNSQGSSFAQNTLKEIYNFDLPLPPSGSDANMRAWVNAVLAWTNTGDPTDKMVRVYTQSNFIAPYRRLLGRTPPAQTPYDESDASGNRTAVVVPGDAWARVSNQVPKPNGEFQIVHQLISDLLLTDALRRSRFP